MPLVAEKYNNQSVGSEALLSKFYKLAKDHFQISVRNDNDPINLIKESIRFFSLDLPIDIKEMFIAYKDAPLFWIFESSLLAQIEDFMKFNFKGVSYLELHKQIKENYSKWATTKLKSEKEYFAGTTINFIERDINKHNFFKMILKGIISTYQPTYYNAARALEMYNNALESINTLRLNDQLKSELKYIIQLYIGFIHLKESDYQKANFAFKDATEIKSQGYTAKLYAALSEVQLENNELALYYIREIFNYDLQRLVLAQKTNNPGMFNYFLRNAFVYNIFYEKDFSKITEMLQLVFDEFRNSSANMLVKCKEEIDLIKSKKLDEYYDDEIRKSLLFLEKTLTAYVQSFNTLIFSIGGEFKKKIVELVLNILSRIKEKFYDEVKEKLSSYDVVIKDNYSAEKHLAQELENFKVKTKENLEESFKKVNENYEIDTKALEQQIENLPNMDRYNPKLSMSNNMTYNVVIAFVVFFIGGIAGYSNRMVDNVSEFNSIFTMVLISGSKWGAISFIIGTIISMFMSGVIIMERYDVKSKLLRRMSYLKIEKDRMLADLKETAVQREKMMIENINQSINQHRKRVDELKVQRAAAERDLVADSDKKIGEMTADIIKITK
jgi:hypothetical protein